MATQASSSAAVETSLDLLHRLIRALENAPALTERGFLDVGTTLQGVRAQIREISEKSAAAAGFISGGEIPALVEGLGNTLERLERLAAAAGGRAELAIDRFSRMREGLDRVAKLMETFQERVATLRMMKTLTTIQSASLGRTAWGFQGVAADIGKLSQNVQAKSAGVIQKARQLNAELKKALAMVQGLGARQNDLGRVVAETIRHGIGSLTAMHEQCAGAAIGVSDRSGEMSREVGEVVMAMQCHDITRQQMQHVRESLAELCLSLRRGGDAEGDRLADISSVCELQAAQLTNTVNELGLAVARISANLQRISRNAADASARAHELSGLADRVGRSSMGEIESGLALVLAAIDENVATGRELTRVMAAVTGAMGEIAAFLGDIDEIGAEIRLIALNAIIKAAQAGRDGAALSVIAQTVEHQSEDICRQVTVITDTILAITGSLDELREELGEGGAAAGREAEMEKVRADLGSFLESLGAMNDTVMALLADVDRATVNLCADVERANGAICAQNVEGLLQDEIIPRLTTLALSARAALRSLPEGETRGVTAAAGRYTMRSERDVHAAFAAPAERGAGAAYDAHGLGDNVEFF